MRIVAGMTGNVWLAVMARPRAEGTYDRVSPTRWLIVPVAVR